MRSSKNAVQPAVSSFVPGAKWSRIFRASSVMPQAQSAARQPGGKALGDPADEEVGGGKFTEVAARLVFQQVSDFTAAAAGHCTLKSVEYTVV